eukprot:NODE_1115_length_1003_cov_0.043142.p4 type:complete len:118 gc:universal NODE_1115_length_1003_cov_0.043142:377-730(+)
MRHKRAGNFVGCGKVRHMADGIDPGEAAARNVAAEIVRDRFRYRDVVAGVDQQGRDCHQTEHVPQVRGEDHLGNSGGVIGPHCQKPRRKFGNGLRHIGAHRLRREACHPGLVIVGHR